MLIRLWGCAVVAGAPKKAPSGMKKDGKAAVAAAAAEREYPLECGPLVHLQVRRPAPGL